MSKLLPKQMLLCEATVVSPRQETLQLLEVSPMMYLHLELNKGKAGSDYGIITF